MSAIRKVTDELYWVGVNDRRTELFENIHPIPEGVSYNSYLLMDKKKVLFDAVDWSGCKQFMANIAEVLGDKELDYIVVNHVEPDHAASLNEVLQKYPKSKVICNEKAAMFLRQFGFDLTGRKEEIKEGDVKDLGRHKITFVNAPMVHWPEAMVTYESTEGILFSADAFGTFKALDGKLFDDEVDFDRDWIDEGRRYFTNIVGKYGPQVQSLLKKAATLDIKLICPLHGPVWRKNLGYYIEKHDKWSKYEPEQKGVLMVYGSMYGHTEAAAQELASRLCERGVREVKVYDASKTHVSYLISEAFKYSHIILASPTYNLEIYPPIFDFLHHMKVLHMKNRTFGIIENGTWAIKSGTLIKEYIENHIPNSLILGSQVSVNSAPKDANSSEFDNLAEAIVKSLDK